MELTSTQRKEAHLRFGSGVSRLAARWFAIVSLLWSAFSFLLFFYVNAAEENPTRLTPAALLAFSTISVLLAVAAAILRSRWSWLAVPLSVFVLTILLYGKLT